MEKERLDEFLNEICRMPLLSADEEKALCRPRWKDGCAS